MRSFQCLGATFDAHSGMPPSSALRSHLAPSNLKQKSRTELGGVSGAVSQKPSLCNSFAPSVTEKQHPRQIFSRIKGGNRESGCTYQGSLSLRSYSLLSHSPPQPPPPCPVHPLSTSRLPLPPSFSDLGTEPVPGSVCREAAARQTCHLTSQTAWLPPPPPAFHPHSGARITPPAPHMRVPHRTPLLSGTSSPGFSPAGPPHPTSPLQSWQWGQQERPKGMGVSSSAGLEMYKAHPWGQSRSLTSNRG